MSFSGRVRQTNPMEDAARQQLYVAAEAARDGAFDLVETGRQNAESARVQVASADHVTAQEDHSTALSDHVIIGDIATALAGIVG